MHNQTIIGLALIGFGLLLLFSDEPYSWVFSAVAVGVGSGFIIKKNKKDDIDT
jgi:hypothetical protein